MEKVMPGESLEEGKESFQVNPGGVSGQEGGRQKERLVHRKRRQELVSGLVWELQDLLT